MVREWFVLFWKRPATKIILVSCLILGALSFVFSNAIVISSQQLLLDPPEGINVENVEYYATNWRALYNYFRYIYESPLHDLFVFGFLGFIGVFLSPQYLADARSGFGNFYMTRTMYRKYSKEVWVAQSIYIVCLVAVSYFSVFCLHFILSGSQFGSFELIRREMSMGWGFVIALAQIVLMSVYFILVNSVSIQLATFIKNPYVMLAVPLVVFGFVPTVITGTIAKINPYFSAGLSFAPTYISVFIKWLLTFGEEGKMLIELGSVFVFLFLLAFSLRVINVKHYSDNYLP